MFIMSMHLIFYNRLSNHTTALALEEAGKIKPAADAPKPEVGPAQPTIDCKLEKFEDESYTDYKRRCDAAAKLANVAEAVKGDFATKPKKESDWSTDATDDWGDISSPEDEW